MRNDGRIEIRSFRVVFELERRLHKIDRWRIPVPYGVPLRGIAYAGAVLVVLVMAQRLPGVGELVGLLPPPLRLVIVPAGIAYALTRLRVDGRPAHAALLALVRLATSPGVVSSLRRTLPTGSVVSLGDVVLAPDECGAAYRRATVRGPCRVLLRFPARARARGRRLAITQASGEPMPWGKEVRLQRGQRLVVR